LHTTPPLVLLHATYTCNDEAHDVRGSSAVGFAFGASVSPVGIE